MRNIRITAILSAILMIISALYIPVSAVNSEIPPDNYTAENADNNSENTRTNSDLYGTFWIRLPNSRSYLTKGLNMTPAIFPLGAANTMKWQFVESTSLGYFHIVNADTTVLSTNGVRCALTYSPAATNGINLTELGHNNSLWTFNQKWSIIPVDATQHTYKICGYYGAYLKISMSTVTYTFSSSDATVFEIIRASNAYTPYSETQGYVSKINNSNLVDYMNCYAYAIGAYLVSDPFIAYGGYDENEGHIFIWTTGKLQMGVISGNPVNFDDLIDSYKRHNTADHKYYLDNTGISTIESIIQNAVNDDLEQIYGLSNNVIKLTENMSTSDLPLGDWRKVALAITGIWDDEDCPNGEGETDYHWYVENDNGYWTHKPGTSIVSALDDSGDAITDPATADRGIYDCFVGYYYIRSDNIFKKVTDMNNTVSVSYDGSGDYLYHSKTIGEIYQSRTLNSELDYLGIEYYTTARFIYPEQYFFYYTINSINSNGATFVRHLVVVNIFTNSIVYLDDDGEIIGPYNINDLDDMSCDEFDYVIRDITPAVHTEVSYSTPQDVDYYEFTVYNGGTYEIYTEYFSSSEKVDTYGRLYLGDTYVASNQDGGYDKNFRIEIQLDANKVYRLAVTGGATDQRGHYILTINKE